MHGARLRRSPEGYHAHPDLATGMGPSIIEFPPGPIVEQEDFKLNL